MYNNLVVCIKHAFSIIAMTPRGTFELYCVYIAQLMTHTVIYTIPLTLQLCYKPLGILQRVTKSQKVHISSFFMSKRLVSRFRLNSVSTPQTNTPFQKNKNCNRHMHSHTCVSRLVDCF